MRNVAGDQNSPRGRSNAEKRVAAGSSLRRLYIDLQSEAIMPSENGDAITFVRRIVPKRFVNTGKVLHPTKV